MPGYDVAGVIAQLGPLVSGWKLGAAVLSMIDRHVVHGLNGGYAEYVVIVPAANVITKPPKMSFAQAAGLGLAGTIGARLADQAHLRRHERVLITGVSSEIGSSAAQVALARGAHVIGTAAPQDFAYLRSLGIDELLDDTQGDWADRANDIQVVLDTVGEDTGLLAFNTLNKGGSFISVASRDIQLDKCVAAGVKCPALEELAAVPPSEPDLLRQVSHLALVANSRCT